MDALHAVWASGALRIWGESPGRWARAQEVSPDERREHPFSASADALRERLGRSADTDVELRLPTFSGVPEPSPTLAHAVGHSAHEHPEGGTTFEKWRVPAVVLPANDAPGVLEGLIDELGERRVCPSIRFFAAAARFARHLLVQQRFVPMLLQEPDGTLSGAWRPWLADDQTYARASALARSMPMAARASSNETEREPWTVLDAMLAWMLDDACRRTLDSESMADALEHGDPAGDPQVAWLAGLLDGIRRVEPPLGRQSEMIRSVREWVAQLDERGASAAWHLRFRVEEPKAMPEGEPDDNALWLIRFELCAADNPAITVEAADIWSLPADGFTIEGRRVDAPHELLLGELGRASRVWNALERALDQAEPVALPLKTAQAYEFLREARPALEEQGFHVEPPEWWDSPAMRLGARLRIDSEPPEGAEEEDPGGGASAAAASRLGLGTLVSYHWEIAVGDKTLTLHEFEQLAASRKPLVRFGSHWVEVRPEDVETAIKFIRANPGGQMAFGEALRMAYASDADQTGVPVVGLEVGGWLSSLLDSAGFDKLPDIHPPATFMGTLRPYQQRGLSWLAFMERFGFGACLADDMGLGKTVQFLALLAYEREHAKEVAAEAAKPHPDDPAADVEREDAEHELVLPTLLVVPMSVVGNWMREAERFTPSLRVLVHHGADRLTDDALVEACKGSDIVVTTYALANRDNAALARVQWRRIVLDEAQSIKNPQAKQSQAVRMLPAERRIALTGTPVENRLTELWSIMDFLNPGYLGPPGTFRRKFAVPIERYRDQSRAEQLRSLIGPFVLRRLKTDPTIIADLPAKVESREFCHLTAEQAALYEDTVKRILTDVDRSAGIHRRGMVLAALIKLKQICNHPAQALRDFNASDPTPPDPSRSGKCIRILEMLDEVLAAGDRALIFTQFRQMGNILSTMLRHELDREVLFLHGGTPQKARVAMIDRFQEGEDDTPIMILSLKAGGVGLNLTAANHVFHFDRWWNPAVENQATDRAFRIGQTRTVQVHKFVVRGTLEERIDEMIEQKTELAESIVGSGERWLTELDTDDLKRILTLRNEAVDIESE